MLAFALMLTGCSVWDKLQPPPPPPTVGPLTLIPDDLSFGRQKSGSSSHIHVFTLTNPPTNDGVAIITQVEASGPPFMIDQADTNCAGHTLTVGAHCQIGVSFAPTTAGPQTGTLAITDNGENSPQLATLKGDGN
ncbi:MAG: hypothetical protein IVW54_04660 [Candidatus Binataceae bacterium]|nr:hypothetical protein [Candidatus Binataceae bacterium]